MRRLITGYLALSSMQQAEFEEKDFEGPLYNQLLFGSNLIATPGQVFEGHFGLDAAMFAEHPLFWHMFGFPDIPTGVILPDFNWGWVWRRTGRTRQLPTFAVNLLIQSKRPDCLIGPNYLLARHGIRKSYWRFKSKEHQQSLLAKLANTLGNRAFVIYASAAFDTFDDLYTHTKSQTIVENSAFVRIERMQNHHSWNYDTPGMVGVAMSEPEFIRDRPFIEQLEQMSTTDPQDPLIALQTLEKLTLMAIYETDDNPYANYIQRLNDNWTYEIDRLNIDNASLTKSFSHLLYLYSLMGLDWFAIA